MRPAPGTLRALFDDPPRDFGPTPLWWWSAEEVTRERLEWQMRRFHDGGVDNLVVINLAPAGPLFGAPSDDPQWFSDAWWDRFRDACAVAQELGTRLWFYDQIGFSGANIQGRITHEHPWAAGRDLQVRRRVVTGGGGFELAPHELLVAAYRADGERVPVSEEGTTDAEEGRELQLVVSTPTAFDYLDAGAVDLLLDTVHREFERRVPEHLGGVIAGSFQDELPATNAWTSRFPDEFLRRRGYDLLDHLPGLFTTGGVQEAKVRSDYYAVRAELTEEALFEPLARWHESHGMLAGADQSNPARAGYPLQGTQIYTDYPRTHRHLSAVGSDHEGDSKVHSSLAHLYGHDRVWLEAFHSTGWGGTLEDTWDWLTPFLRRGATLYNPHATYFSTVGGWFEWAPPSTDWRQPYWSHYPDFARAVARVTSMLSWGSFQADVAVLHPTATMQALLPVDLPVDHFLQHSPGPEPGDAARAQAVYLSLCGKDDWFHHQPSALDVAGIAFDVVDDDSVRRATHEGGRLTVRQQSYSTVVIPSAPFLEQDTAAGLVRLMDGGGHVVVVGRPPTTACGLAGDDGVVRRVVEHERCLVVDDVEAAVEALPRDQREATSDVPLLVRRSGTTSVALVSGAYPNATTQPVRSSLGLGRWDDIEVDRSRYATRRSVTVGTPVGRAEVWDPTTGRRAPAAVERRGGGATITVDTGGAALVLLVWDETGDGGRELGDPPAATAAASGVGADTTTQDISTGWTGELVSTMDNTYGDLARPVGAPLDQLQIWSMSTREDDGPWRPAKVTFGQRVLVHPPAAPKELPAPLDEAGCVAVLEGRSSLGQDEGWQVHEHSSSRGRERDHAGELGTKGAVPSEFLVADDPGPGQQCVVRALVVTEHRGAADLVVDSSAQVEVWWNGRPQSVTDRYSRTLRVLVDQETNVLEYRLGSSRTEQHTDDARVVRSSFTLTEPGAHGDRPEYMVSAPAEDLSSDGVLVFRATVPPVGAVREARLVVGAARAATVLVNGRPLARQEKVEYYESEWGATPAFFSHDASTALRGVDDVLEVRLETGSTRDVLFVDLAVRGDEGIRTLVSGEGWTCSSGGRSVPTVPDPRQWSPLESAHAVLRPHPLPGADWLRGAPEVGSPALSFAVTDTTAPTVQHHRLTLPAGARRARLPLLVDADLTLDGSPVEAHDGLLDLGEALRSPAVLEVTTAPVLGHRAGAVWDGPVLVDHERSPISLGDWRDLGLAAWSGGVRYHRQVEVAAGAPWQLDLGDLRGTVEVVVDDVCVGRSFCAPYRYTCPATTGTADVEITVRNTLGPFLHESTPTTWVFPSQLASGLFGPVTTSASAPTENP